MKILILISLLLLSVKASVLKRPTYRPDENHNTSEKVMMPRQAEEERPMASREKWKENRERRKKEAIKYKMPKHK